MFQYFKAEHRTQWNIDHDEVGERWYWWGLETVPKAKLLFLFLAYHKCAYLAKIAGTDLGWAGAGVMGAVSWPDILLVVMRRDPRYTVLPHPHLLTTAYNCNLYLPTQSFY